MNTNKDREKLTQKRLKELLHYNPITGLFTWVGLRVSSRVGNGSVAGTLDRSGYVFIKIQQRRYAAHRLAFLYMTGNIPKEVDHINHTKHHNEWENLRGVTHGENQKNASMSITNTSGFTGVSWHKGIGKWTAYICVGKLKHLGSFCQLADAVKARIDAEIEYDYHKNHGVLIDE